MKESHSSGQTLYTRQPCRPLFSSLLQPPMDVRQFCRNELALVLPLTARSWSYLKYHHAQSNIPFKSSCKTFAYQTNEYTFYKTSIGTPHTNEADSCRKTAPWWGLSCWSLWCLCCSCLVLPVPLPRAWRVADHLGPLLVGMLCLVCIH